MAALLHVSRREVAALCMEFWEWCDETIPDSAFNSVGSAFVTLSPRDSDNMAFVDAIVGTAKFADSLAAVEWIRFRDGRIELPGFALHNGETAKTRARNANNQKKKRDADKTPSEPQKPKRVTTTSPRDGDKKVTREEREKSIVSSVEETIPPNPPGGEIGVDFDLVENRNPSVTYININDETIDFNEDPPRWVAEFIKRWNKLAGVSKHTQAALSAPNYVELRKRLSDPEWDWKAAFLKFPLDFPEGKAPNLTFFLKWDSVSKILDNTYERTRTKQAGLFGRPGESEATRIRTGETEAFVAAAFESVAARSGQAGNDGAS